MTMQQHEAPRKTDETRGAREEQASRVEDARTRSALRALRLYSPGTLQNLIADFDVPLNDIFADEIEGLLNAPEVGRDSRTDTLMPAWMERFGIDAHALRHARPGEFRHLGGVCGDCALGGRCWRALRSGEAIDACRTFCPNAEAFDRLASAA